ncbi:MAG: hypothetical protein ACLQJR_21945 [Stellaceae bacterium]
MRSHGPAGGLALVALILASGAAKADCAEDLQQLQARIERQQKASPTPQSAAAAEVLRKFAAGDSAAGDSQDEVDCYNAVARARRALNEPAPPPQTRR